MKRFALFLTLVAAMCGGSSLSYAQSPAGCNPRVWEPHPDNPVDYTHSFTQPAIAWDVEYALATVAIAKTLERVTPLSPLWSAAATSIPLGVGLHLLGHLQGRYPVSMHWAFVAADRALPVVLAVPDSSRGRALTTWAVVTTGLVCFDR